MLIIRMLSKDILYPASMLNRQPLPQKLGWRLWLVVKLLRQLKEVARGVFSFLVLLRLSPAVRSRRHALFRLRMWIDMWRLGWTVWSVGGVYVGIFSARDTIRSSPPAACIQPVAAITATIISITSIGGEVGPKPNPKTRIANPRPPITPRPIPCKRAAYNDCGKYKKKLNQHILRSKCLKI